MLKSTMNITHSLRLLAVALLLLPVGCADIEQVLEYEGVIEEVQTVEYGRGDGGFGSYRAMGVSPEGIIFAPIDDFDEGVDLVSADGRKIRTFAGGGGFSGPRIRDVKSVAVSSDGRLVAMAGIVQFSSSNAVLVYEIATGDRASATITPPSGVDGDVMALAFSGSGDTLAVGYGDDVALYDISTSVLRQPTIVKGEPFEDATTIDFSPTDGDRLVVPGGILSISSRSVIIPFDGTDQYFNRVAFSGDGRYVVGVGSRGFHLIDAASGEEVGNLREVVEFSGEFDEQPDALISMDVTSDGDYAVTADEGGVITVWEIATGAIVARTTITGGTSIHTAPDEPGSFYTTGWHKATLWQINL